jgi:hypothetical protein
MGISVQFHAMPFEILGLFADLFFDDEIFCVEAVGSPSKFLRLNKGLVPKFDENRKAMAFALGEPDVIVGSMFEFLERNPDALVLEIGQVSALGLKESWLSANTKNPTALSRWRKVAKNLHVSTLDGAIAINPKNGAECHLKWHRFTEEARLAFHNGVAMLPAAGNAIIQFR